MNLKTFVFSGIVAFLFFACGSSREETAAERNATAENVSAAPEETSQLEQEHQLFRASYADSVNQGLIAEDTMVTSARREAQAQVGEATVKVNYGSPGKRGRVLWNGLVSYDIIWVSGSHWATAVEFSEDVRVGDTLVPAGMYAFYTIPGREKWTLILNENYDQHLADDYDQAEDIVRIEAKPETLDEVVQRLTYEVEETAAGEGEISLMWDQLKVSMPFEVAG
jgi:hypothetical protein